MHGIIFESEICKRVPDILFLQFIRDLYVDGVIICVSQWVNLYCTNQKFFPYWNIISD